MMGTVASSYLSNVTTNRANSQATKATTKATRRRQAAGGLWKEGGGRWKVGGDKIAYALKGNYEIFEKGRKQGEGEVLSLLVLGP